MGTEVVARFVEEDQRDSEFDGCLKVREIEDSTAGPAEGSDGSESEGEGLAMEKSEDTGPEIPFPPMEKPPVIHCALLLRFIDAAIAMLWTLSFVSQDLLLCEDPPTPEEEGDAADEPIYPAIDGFGERFDEELVEKLKQLADRKKKLQEMGQTISCLHNTSEFSEARMRLTTSAWLLCCHFITHKDAHDQLAQTGMQQSPELMYLCDLLEKLRHLALTRFSTSLQQEEALERYRAEIFRREEKAIGEHDLVTKNLKDERQKRADDLAQYLKNERLIQQDKDNSVVLAKQLEEQLKADCAALAAQEFAVFNAEYTTLSTENKKMREMMFELQNKDRDKELQMRGKKGQSIEEVADLLWEYEDDITSHAQKLNASTIEHAAIAEQLTTMQAYFTEKTRLAAIKAEELRIYREANVAKRRAKWLPIYAAKRIQRYWSRFKQRQAATEKATTKGKDKKEKGKKGGKKKGRKKKE